MLRLLGSCLGHSTSQNLQRLGVHDVGMEITQGWRVLNFYKWMKGKDLKEVTNQTAPPPR